VAGQLARLLDLGGAVLEEVLDVLGGDLELGHAGPPGLDHLPGAVLLGGQADRCGLDPHRQVLGDEHHVVALRGEGLGDGENAGVVVAEPETGRQDRGVAVVELDPDRPLADGHRLVQPPVPSPQIVEEPQCLPREVAELGMVALRLQLGDHDDRQDHLMLGEPCHRGGVRQQDRGVDDVGAPIGAGTRRGAVRAQVGRVGVDRGHRGHCHAFSPGRP